MKKNIFSTKNCRKKSAFFDQVAASFRKALITTLFFFIKTPTFSPKINWTKIAENGDHNIDPWPPRFPEY
jgi:hypothetical protein